MQENSKKNTEAIHQWFVKPGLLQLLSFLVINDLAQLSSLSRLVSLKTIKKIRNENK
tara:strand:+ start:127 stop:297 length:171 start_codon:yes stop_codon:yes gene_type:complete